MPQIQVLPAVPTFGSKLAQAIGGAVGDVGESYYKKKGEERRTLADQKVLEAIAQNPNSSDMDYISAYNKLSKQGKEQNQTLINTLIGSRAKAETAKAKEIAKIEAKNEEKNEEIQGIKSTLDELDELAEYAGSTLIPGKSFFGGDERYANIFNIPFNRDAAEKRELIDKLGFWAADKAYTHFNKGTVSNVKFESIKKDLAPNSNLPERIYKSRVAALRKVFNLPSDISKEKFEKVLEQEIDKVKKTESKEKKVDEKATVKMISPLGKEVDVPQKDVENALSRNTGWKLANA